MRSRLVFFILLLSFCFKATGQDYPARWQQYTTPWYIYAIEEDFKNPETTQSVLINTLLNRARLNVAKQVNISIVDKADLIKKSLNGVTNIDYSSETTYTTDASMHLLKTDSEYNSGSSKGFAIAYLDKKELWDYWSKEAGKILSDQETEYDKANRMITLGYKEKAKESLVNLTKHYNAINEPLTWLNLCSYPESEYQGILNRFSSNVKKIETAILALGHGTTIFLDYNSDLFGEEYPATKNQLSSKLSSEERSFVEDPLEADWIIKIDAKAREGQQSTLGSSTVFIAYIDITLTIIKGSTAQTVYKDAISVKEGDTSGFQQAAKMAFQNVAAKLYDTIEKNIKE